MNKINWTANGGAPVANEDWEFQTAGIAEAIKGSLSFLGTDIYLSGGVADFAGTNIYLQGYAVLGGEVYRITNNEADMPALPFVYIEIDVQDDPNGVRTFENTTV